MLKGVAQDLCDSFRCNDPAGDGSDAGHLDGNWGSCWHCYGEHILAELERSHGDR